jgi:hypothetical protein
VTRFSGDSMGKMLGKKKATPKKASKFGKIGSSLSGLLGRKGGGGKRRNRGPAYWANKVIVAKLKKKYRRVTYGGV